MLDEQRRSDVVGAMDSYVRVTKTVSPDAKNMFAWIEWIVMADLPITIVDNEYYRKRSNLKPTSYKTVSKHMEALMKILEANIKRGLPQTFGLLFDGWSCDGEHYIGIFSTWVRDDGTVLKRLISCGVQDLPEGEAAAASFGFAAEDIGDYVFDVLAKYDRDFSAIEFMTGDNAYVNSRLCNLISDWLWDKKKNRRVVPLIGCAAHRLNLSVQHLFSADVNPEWHELIQKVHALMSDLKTIKNRPRLAVATHLAPQIRQDTRWNSTYHMLVKYLNICKATENFQTCVGFSLATRRLVPTFTGSLNEHTAIEEIVKVLAKFEEVSVWLQHQDSKKIPLNKIRYYFDAIIKIHPETSAYLSKDGDNVNNEHFETAIAKIQTAVEKHEETVRLTKDEKDAVVIFLKKPIEDSDDDDEVHVQESFIRDADDEYEMRVLKKSKMEFPYVDTSHVAGTSVIVEQLFSRCGIIMRPHRRLMDPSTLEMLVMFRFNKDLWDEEEVERAMKGEPQPLPAGYTTPLTAITTVVRSSSSSISSSAIIGGGRASSSSSSSSGRL